MLLNKDMADAATYMHKSFPINHDGGQILFVLFPLLPLSPDEQVLKLVSSAAAFDGALKL